MRDAVCNAHIQHNLCRERYAMRSRSVIRLAVLNNVFLLYHVMYFNYWNSKINGQVAYTWLGSNA